ncbi:MAG TPA: aminotransferase, partial [Terrimesophilobacter sp.]|nr:aminotransferase [Terrimesophilobacter sp.]
AECGERMLPQYHFDPLTGLWKHRSGPVEPPLRFDGIRYDDHGRLRYPTTDDVAPAGARRAALAEARALLESLPEASAVDADLTPLLGADAERLRRFRLPAESLLPT